MRFWTRYERQKRIIDNTIWLALDKGAKVTLSFALSVLIARKMGADSLGMYNLILSFVIITNVIATLGLNNVLIKEFVSTKNLSESIESAFVYRIIGAVGCYFLSVCCAFFLFQDDQLFKYALVAILSVLCIPTQVFEFYFNSTLKSKYNSISRLIAYFSSFLMKLYGLYFEVFDWVIYGISFEFALLALFNYFYFKRLKVLPTFRFGRLFEKEKLRSYWDQSWPIMFSSIGVILYMKMDQFFIYKFFDNSNVGLYTASTRIVEALYILPTIIMTSLFPKLLERREKSYRRYEEGLMKILKKGIITSSIVAVIVLILSDYIILLVYGRDFQDSSMVLKIYSFSLVIAFINTVLSKWLIAEGLTVFSLVRHSMGILSNLVLNYILIPKYGIYGASFASLISLFFANIAFLPFSQKTRPFFNLITYSIGKSKK